MDKQGKIGIALTIIVLIAWQIYTAKTYKPPVTPLAATATASPVEGATATATPQNATASTGTKKPAVPVEETVPVQTQKIATPSVDFVFTNHGGGILRAELLQHAAEDDHHVTLNEYGTIPIGALSEKAGEGANAAYTVTGNMTNGVTYERTTSDQIQITKKFTLPTAGTEKDQYITTLDVTFANRGDKAFKSDGYFIYVGSAAPIHVHDMPMYIGYDWYRNGKATDINVMSFSAGKIPLIGYETSSEKKSITASADSISWAGTYSQYFTSIVTAIGGSGNRAWATRFPVDITTRLAGAEWERKNPGATPVSYVIDGALGMPAVDLQPGATVTQKFQIYTGPRQYQVLKQLDGGEKEILQFGMFGFVSKLLLSAMNFIKPFVGSYAVAIIVLTLLIKSLLWPWQNKATQSMKKMQALSPKMTEIKEKYKDDPTRMNQETMKLYKDYGINPFGGCLPMIIQLPVFFGFYRMLGTAIELRNSTFFWVHDLSQPDTVFILAGIHINILPLCMAATNVWMMTITPNSGDKTQQRMMMFMPLIFLFICYNYASGLALYMMVQNLFSVAQLYLTRNQVAPIPQKVAVAKKKR